MKTNTPTHRNPAIWWPSARQVLFEIGIGLEVWVTSLVKNAGSRRLRSSRPLKGSAWCGIMWISMSTQTRLRMRMPKATPTSGLTLKTWRLCSGTLPKLSYRWSPDHADTSRNNQATYLQQLDRLSKELSDRVRRLPDRRFVVPSSGLALSRQAVWFRQCRDDPAPVRHRAFSLTFAIID